MLENLNYILAKTRICSIISCLFVCVTSVLMLKTACFHLEDGGERCSQLHLPLRYSRSCQSSVLMATESCLPSDELSRSAASPGFLVRCPVELRARRQNRGSTRGPCDDLRRQRQVEDEQKQQIRFLQISQDTVGREISQISTEPKSVARLIGFPATVLVLVFSARSLQKEATRDDMETADFLQIRRFSNTRS